MVFVFQPDEQLKTLIISVIDDNLLEVPENFALSLFKDTSIPNVNVEPSIASFFLVDNEGTLCWLYGA